MRSPYEAMGTRATVLMLLSLSLFSCSLPIPIMPAGMRDLTDANWAGRYGALRQSMYFGPFYDDPTVELLDPRPFGDLTYLMTPWKKAVGPGTERGILPVGTRVRIERVEMPSLGSLVGRPLLAPRYNGYVYLRANRFDVTDSLLFKDKTFVMVLPFSLTDPDQVDGIMSTLVGEEDSVRAWLAQRKPSIREAIITKQAVMGMTYEELVAALGAPDRIDRSIIDGKRREEAVFGTRMFVLTDDVVTSLP